MGKKVYRFTFEVWKSACVSIAYFPSEMSHKCFLAVL